MGFIKQIVDIFHKQIKNKFIRFLFVGGLNTVFGYSVYCLMVLIGLSYVWATVVQQVLGVLFNFMTTGSLVFENNDKKLLFKFIICYGFSYFISIGVNKGLQEVFGINLYFAGAGGIIVSALFSFFILKLFVYKKENDFKE